LNRDEKAAIISELNESFSKSKFSVVADYRGLTVAQMQQIRIELRKFNSELRVAKNTLLKRAVTETDSAVLSDDFTGTTAVVMAYDDPVGPAKALADFAKDHKKFVLRSAVLDGEKISPEELIALVQAAE
jgi:large subunit ribosomal protein L10